jgi:two-component system OmpR family sensor kinase
MKVKWWWVLAPFPLTLAILIVVLTASGRLANPILYLRGDLATLFFLVSLLLSGVLASLVLQDFLADRRYRRALIRFQHRAATERRRFLRRLDHELKNPLTAIRAGLANLSSLPGEAARQTALNSVEAQTLRLSRLASDLRKLAELETRPLELAPVNLTELLQEVTAVAGESPKANQRRLTLNVPQAPWPLPTISGDPDLLFLAVHNLLDNALKFTQPGDTVELRAFEDGARVVIEVADTGPGIPESELPHIWEELYRGQGARGVPGSGLGLALVRAITDRHGGQLSIRSRVGQGTVVTLRLPIREVARR